MEGPLGSRAINPRNLTGLQPLHSELEDILQQPEGKTLEFKRDISSPDKIIRTVVAFANGAGGRLIIGVEDGSREIVGVPEISQEEERLTNLIADRIEPRLVPDIHILPWRKKHVLAVDVFPSPTRPHFVKAMGMPAGVYIRIGSSNRQADDAVVAELQRVVNGRSFDEEPLPECNCEAIDFALTSQLFAPIRKLTRQGLYSLQLLAHHQGREVATVGGVILFGVDRLRYFPDAYLRAGCFEGTDKSVILDSADITDCPILAVEKALQFVQRNTRRALEIRGVRHRAIWEFPMVALREAIINAFVHADYAQRGSPLRVAVFDDRIEVDNPGNLPPGLTIEEIRRGISKLRNRVVGRVFHELEFIEQWGSGIRRMIGACCDAGLPEPIFEELGTGFRVTFYRQRQVQSETDPLDAGILEFVRANPGAPTSQIAAHIKRSARATQLRLKKLSATGQIVAVATSEHDPRKGYRLKAKS
jgi:predicted HTH transcriptional regulator